MEVIYRKKNREKLYVEIDSFILANEPYKKYTTGYKLNEDSYSAPAKIRLDILMDSNNKTYFEIDGEIIYFEDFSAMSTDKLIFELNGDGSKDGLEDAVFATFYQSAENIGILVSAKKLNMFNTDIQLSRAKARNEEILWELVENRIPKTKWRSKLTLSPVSEEHKRQYSPVDCYFTSLVTLLKNGQAKLVNKNTYSEKEFMGREQLINISEIKLKFTESAGSYK